MTLPVLAHVRLEHSVGSAGSASCVTAYATDLDMTLIIPMACAEAAGSMHASLPATLLYRVVKEADKGSTVHLSVADGRCELQWQANSAPVCQAEAMCALEDFPPVDTSAFNVGMTMTPEAMDLLSVASLHQSTDECRYVLNGVYFAQDGNCLVATDGNRLLRAVTPMVIPCSAIVPTKAVDMMLKHMPAGGHVWFVKPPPNQDGSETMQPEATAVMAQLEGGALLVSKCIDGKFPNYRQVIPTQAHYTGQITLESKDLMKRLMPMANGGVARLRLQEHRMEVLPFYRTDDARFGTTAEWQAIGTTDSDASLEMGVNGNFLILATRELAKPVIYFIDAISPIVVQSGRAQVVVMPYRLAA